MSFGAAFRQFVGDTRVGIPAPLDWRPWLTTLFPNHVSAGFAPRHVAFWDWVWQIEADSSPDPFIGIWPRGGGKTSSAELATAAMGMRGRRKYALYVRGSQARADDSVGNIGRLLERSECALYYPSHSERAVNKYGASQGWRRERLSTAGGFTVDAIGMDTVARGVKLDDQRPDLFIFDDIDEKLDTPATTAKKIATLTTSLLPAGAVNVAVLGIQNLIHGDGIFARMVDGRADFLARRHVSGPHPAVHDLQMASEPDAQTGIKRHVIVNGTASWDGQDLTVCQKQVDEWGVDAFLREAQHQVMDRSDGLALRYSAADHLETLTDDDAKALVAKGRVFGGADFGHWRFGFVLRVADQAGKIHELAHYFNQRDGLEVRARAVHALCAFYGVKPHQRFRGDAANPTDIKEINEAFKRIGSGFRMVAVAQENKARRSSVEKLNDLLDRHALCYRRDSHRYVAAILASTFQRPAAEFLTWRLGYNASSHGTEMSDARLLWEVQHWGYPVPQEGKAQAQDPDDHTADGADCIAADRYAIMSHIRPGKPDEEDEIHSVTPEMWAAHAERTTRLKHRKQQRKVRPSDSMHGDY